MTDGEYPDTLETLRPRFTHWAERLRAMGMDGLVGSLLNVAGPLAPLGAQVLYIAQPALGLVISRQAVGDLAQVLETPGGVEWLQKTMDL